MSDQEKVKSILMSSTRAKTICGEHMAVFVRTLAEAVTAEMADALIAGEPRRAPDMLEKVAQTMGGERKKAPMTVGDVALKHLGKLSEKDRRRVAGNMMTHDVITGHKLSASGRGQMRMMVRAVRKTHFIENKKLIEMLAAPLTPREEIKPADHLRWNRHWIRLLREINCGGSDVGGGSGGGSAPGTPPPHSQLQFRLHEVICEDDTRELARDEISIGAVSGHGTLDEADTVTNASEPIIAYPYDLGQYRTGDSRSFGPLTVEDFLLSGLSFPRLFVVNLALAEIDHGGFAGFLEDLYEAVNVYLVAIIGAIGSAIGAAIGAGAAAGGTIGSIAGPLGSLIGAAIGVTIGAIVAAISAAARDEIFEVQTCSVELPSRTSSFNGSDESPIEELTYMGFGGEYRLRYNWRLT